MLETIIAACGGAAIAVIGQLIMWLVNRKATKHERNAQMADGVMVLLQDRLKHLAKHYIADGQIDPEDLQEIIAMHECYKALGGNGYLDTLMQAVRSLTIIN